jgi:hypothetical protein
LGQFNCVLFLRIAAKVFGSDLDDRDRLVGKRGVAVAAVDGGVGVEFVSNQFCPKIAAILKRSDSF